MAWRSSENDETVFKTRKISKTSLWKLATPQFCRKVFRKNRFDEKIQLLKLHSEHTYRLKHMHLYIFLFLLVSRHVLLLSRVDECCYSRQFLHYLHFYHSESLGFKLNDKLKLDLRWIESKSIFLDQISSNITLMAILRIMMFTFER